MPDRRTLRPPDEGSDNAAESTADEVALAIVARHALHDEELVAALAAGALDGEDEAEQRTRAVALVDRCPACRTVHDDVAAIVGATRGDVSFTARAPRDYRLTVDDARRLGGTVTTRGPLAGFGRVVAALVGFGRPIGASLAALGLVGVLVGGAMLGSLGVGGASPSTKGGDTGTTNGSAAGAASAAPAAAPSSLEVAVNPGKTPAASERTVFDVDNAGPNDAVASGDPIGLLLLASVLAVVLGLGLFVYGTMAGRRGGEHPNDR